MTLPAGYEEVDLTKPEPSLSDCGAFPAERANATFNGRERVHTPFYEALIRTSPARVQSCYYSGDFPDRFPTRAGGQASVPTTAHVLCKYCSTVGPDGPRCSYCGANDRWRQS